MTAGGGRARRGGSFIPRTLAELEAGGPGRTAVIRAALIVALLALAIFAILTVRLGGSQVNLRAGDVAQADVRATETVTYQSAIETEQARRGLPPRSPTSTRRSRRGRTSLNDGLYVCLLSQWIVGQL